MGRGFSPYQPTKRSGERRGHRPGHNRFFSIFGPPKALAEGKWTFKFLKIMHCPFDALTFVSFIRLIAFDTVL